MRHWIVGVALVCCAVLFLPAPLHAQASISGIVQDSTGAVLPGVTVEAASPALIERVRSVTTDNAGRYTIVELRPGTYTVTFSLTGFGSVKREGLVLEGAFIAQVNADLHVGAVEETLTVSGDAPLVDVQGTRQQFVANREMLDVLPTARTFNGRAAMIPGVTTNKLGAGTSVLTVHGSPNGDAYTYIDGMRSGAHLLGTGNTGGGPGWVEIPYNDAGAAEVSFDTGAQSAEMQVAGIRLNLIPKEGGNVFSGTAFAYGAGSGVQSDNRTPELKAAIRDANRLAWLYEINPAIGGPVVKNRLWFFGAFSADARKDYIADTYLANGQQASNVPAMNHAEVVRLTSQVTARNRVRLSVDRSDWITKRTPSPTTSPEAAVRAPVVGLLSVAKWTSPVTSRLLIEAGVSVSHVWFHHDYQPEVGPFDLSHLELTTGGTTVAVGSRWIYKDTRPEFVSSVSYVTGSHAFKSGVSQLWGYQALSNPHNANISSLRFVGGLANSVTVTNGPNAERDELNADLGVYAQDRWTLQRLTLNLGARFDHFNVSIPAQSAPPGNFVPARSFAPIANQPNFNDWAVRIGGAYDLFGGGRTALKAYANKYVAGQSMALTSPYNPMALQTENRSWQDLDGNGTVLDANGRVQDNEVGPALNRNFGLSSGTTRTDPNLPRDYNWEESVLIQHELAKGIGLTAGYYRRQFYNLRWTDNLLVDPVRDYTPFTIAAPLDPRLPNGGGELITLYNLNPDKLGLVDNLVTASSTNSQKYDGFEITANGRLANGAMVFGSVTTERLSSNNCEVDNPNALRFCATTPPFRTLFKISGSYPLPYNLRLSAMFQAKPGLNQSGRSLGATYNVTSALAGVPLTGGGTLSVPLIAPNTIFYDSQNTLDLRLMRGFRLGKLRLNALADVYNVFNVGTIAQVNETWGPLWGRPQLILQGRYVRFGTQIDF
jgi:hypothetical protein